MRKTLVCEKGHINIKLHGELCPDVFIDKGEVSSGEWRPSQVSWGVNADTSFEHASEMLHMLRSAVMVARDWDEKPPKLYRLDMKRGHEKPEFKLVNAYLIEHVKKYFEDACAPHGFELISIFEVNE